MTWQVLVIPLIEAALFLYGFVAVIMKANSKFVKLSEKVESLEKYVVKNDSRYDTLLTSIQNLSIQIAKLEQKLEK